MLNLNPLDINTTKVIQVIVTQDRRGTGKQNSPVRLVNQIFTLDGQLIAEQDSRDEENQKFTVN